MEIVARYSDATISLIGEKEVERIEGVDVIKYLRRMLDRLDYDWPEVLGNIWKARQVWEQLGDLLRKEGAEPTVLEKIIAR